MNLEIWFLAIFKAPCDSFLIPLMLLIMKMLQLGCLCFQGKTSRRTEAVIAKDSLLKELSEHHHRNETVLYQKHREEIKHSGLSSRLTAPHQTLHFLEEIPDQLSICGAGFQIPDSDFTEQEVSSMHFAYATPTLVTSLLWRMNATFTGRYRHTHQL